MDSELWPVGDKRQRSGRIGCEDRGGGGCVMIGMGLKNVACRRDKAHVWETWWSCVY